MFDSYFLRCFKMDMVDENCAIDGLQCPVFPRIDFKIMKIVTSRLFCLTQ